MEFVLQTKELKKKYKNMLAVNSVNMNIRKGDIYGFIGENGAGKSTIIRLITGIANPTGGSFTLFSGEKQRLGRLAAVVETPAIHLSLSAKENLEFQCTLLGIINKTSKVNEILDLVGLGYLKDNKKLAKSFSLGMKQRLGIAMALISDPDFIVLDEPMNGLDPMGIIQVRDLILKLNQEKGITFLISSHILSELDRVATVYGFISHGVLLQEISAKELHKSLEKYIKFTFEEMKAEVVKKVLQEYKYTIGDNNVIIYDIEDGNELTKKFFSEGLVISNVEKVVKTIEDYYMNIIGGRRNA